MVEAHDPLLGIGEFARRSRLSLKALRLYDQLGLLAPAHVDPSSGYRKYRESQLFVARLIVLLRHLDMPLSRVAEVITSPGPVGAELVTSYWNDIERRVASQRQIAELLQVSLLGDDARFEGFEVRERDVSEQLVLTERREVRLVEMDDWLTGTKRRLTELAQPYGGMAGRLFVVFHGAVNEDCDGPVEVCVPIDAASGKRADDPSVRIEPAHHEAFVRVPKAQFEMPQIMSAYDAVERWIRQRGMIGAGSPREVYLSGGDISAADPTDDVCDVAYPVRQPL
ncbi:MAG TPA: MerR family transcriptional regulator [Actinopolymorphaceae bacterium]